MPLLETSAALTQLPLVTLYLSERCNSRCVTCDYWRFGKQDVTVEAVRGLLPALRQLQTEVVLLSGGEPLLHPQWAEIAVLPLVNVALAFVIVGLIVAAIGVDPFHALRLLVAGALGS